MNEHEKFDLGMTPEQLQEAQNKNCDLAKREHKWKWVWEDNKTWTGNRMCSTCGKVEVNVTRES